MSATASNDISKARNCFRISLSPRILTLFRPVIFPPRFRYLPDFPANFIHA